MLRSMTGFGRCFLEDGRWTQTWEIRSVNHRYLDFKWRLPYFARALEGRFERLVKKHASRGRIEISLKVTSAHCAAEAGFNQDQAEAMLAAMADLASRRGDTYVPDYNRLLTLGGLWNEETDELDEDQVRGLENGLSAALEDWNEARTGEARALEKDLRARILRMNAWLGEIADQAPRIKEERFELVRARLEEVLDHHGSSLDENRFLQDIAVMADRLDVSEEITRLAAHLDRLQELLSTGDDAGRRLDFTLQECFREIATCGNKVQSAGLSRLVVDFKNELEKCREQVQNLE